jgi:hypothetical protein
VRLPDQVAEIIRASFENDVRPLRALQSSRDQLLRAVAEATARSTRLGD